ncbi:hypothetical protein H4219_002689 [Mycoemilia scoparia]|uniref:Peroxisomal membrane protein PMP34 n=1 Tax=Mycoemilia scoparia TaxID=417184 RepID=A0A9W8DUF4_9FUNG|nr:hypothetical protein H4219_002689 [Mycoemilia scoparia]
MSDNVAHALAGAGGGIISMAITYPLITVSSRLQAQRNNTSESAYKGNLDAVKKIIAGEGIQGLFSGLESALFGSAVTNGVYYYFFEATKSAFEKASKVAAMTTGQSMTAGAIAGAMTVLITNPIWVVNTRLTVKKLEAEEEDAIGNASDSKTKSITTWQAFAKIIKEDGVLSLWQGVIPALILVINPIIQYTVFEQIKNRLQSTRKLGNLDFFFLGAVSKLVATVVTYPYIVVKTRMQLRQSKNESERYNSLLDGLKKILAQEGVQGLFKGISSKVVQSVITAAFLFMTKEALFSYTIRLLAILKGRKARLQ